MTRSCTAWSQEDGSADLEKRKVRKASPSRVWTWDSDRVVVNNKHLRATHQQLSPTTKHRVTVTMTRSCTAWIQEDGSADLEKKIKASPSLVWTWDSDRVVVYNKHLTATHQQLPTNNKASWHSHDDKILYGLNSGRRQRRSWKKKIAHWKKK